MSYSVTFSNYMILEITDGVLTRELDMTYDESKEFCAKQYEAFRQTPEYEETKQKKMDDMIRMDDMMKRATDIPDPDRKTKFLSIIESGIEQHILHYSKKILTD